MIEQQEPHGEGNGADIQLILTDEERVPLYLQIVHQIRYLVSTRELEAGARMPSVRAFAASLGVNTGTVVQAYGVLKEEGILTSQQGRGTYVVSQPGSALSRSARQARLNSLLDKAIADAYAMGFDRSEIRMQFNSSLQAQVRALPVVLVASNELVATKYADLVAAALPEDMLPNVMACTMDELQRGEERVLRAYDGAFFTAVAFLSRVPAVAAALQRLGIESELIGLTTVLSDSTLDALAVLDPKGEYSLLTEARNVKSALALLGENSPLDLRTLRILTELSSEEQLRQTGSSRILYTLGMRPTIDHLDVPHERRLELAFTLSAECRQQLGRLSSSPSLVTPG